VAYGGLQDLCCDENRKLEFLEIKLELAICYDLNDRLLTGECTRVQRPEVISQSGHPWQPPGVSKVITRRKTVVFDSWVCTNQEYQKISPYL
jgi:hypothetical protein